MNNSQLTNLPAIHIPCKNEEALLKLTRVLYENNILSEESVKFINVSEEYYTKLNKESANYKIKEVKWWQKEDVAAKNQKESE